MSSMESAMFSREGREYLIPSCPIAIPSQIPITPNSNGTPPAAAIPSCTFSASHRRWTCPGTMVLYALAIPMNGSAISRSVTPSERRSDRFGAPGIRILLHRCASILTRILLMIDSPFNTFMPCVSPFAGLQTFKKNFRLLF